jgi:hypothetical protein
VRDITAGGIVGSAVASWRNASAVGRSDVNVFSALDM